MRQAFAPLLLLLLLPLAVGAQSKADHANRGPNHPAGFRVGPFVQWVTDTSATIVYRTQQPARSAVEWGYRVQDTTDSLGNPKILAFTTRDTALKTFHQVTLTGLKPNTPIFYRGLGLLDRGGVATGSVRTFRTAPAAESTGQAAGAAFTFGIVGDSQHNPIVWKRVAKRLFAERPSFVLHAGDIVGNGEKPWQWVRQYLRPGAQLMQYVPVYHALGNHDRDGQTYYDAFPYPAPVYHYAFRWGHARVLVLDSNRPNELQAGGTQYTWLQTQLNTPTDAVWTFVVFHHPPYSSDENDYGNTWTSPSTHGHTNLRDLAQLMEARGVDVVFNGHIHNYERTFPLKDSQVVAPGQGTQYVITGGAGGSLERFAPTPPAFQAKVYRGHHFCTVELNGRTATLRAFDQRGQLIDQTQWTK